MASLRYPRDPSLDPQLVWKGKDEQDAADLVVDAPPIFVQERIDPLALLEDLRRAAGAGEPVAPYGIGFGSNRQASTRRRDVRDGRRGDATREVEQIKAYRDTWELGIHSYL